jgi:hypothetical protein
MTMRKPKRILLFLSLGVVLLVAGTMGFGRGEAPQRAVNPVAPAPGESGMRAAIDPETGTLTQPSPEQIRELEQLSGAAKARPSRVETFVLEDGTVGAVLDESFDHSMTLHIAPDGKRHVDCQPGSASPCTHASNLGGSTTALPEE